MKPRRSVVVAAVGAGLLAGLAPLTASAASSGLRAVALTADGTRLSRFDVQRPWGLSPIGGRITGLEGDRKLVGIDRRVQDGRLYGVGDQGGLYRLGGERARKVGQLGVELDGTAFGVDFNPAANALRIVSNRGQNLRQPFGTGGAPAGATVADSPLNTMGAAVTGVVGAAYTNNDLVDTTATTLFDLDSKLDQVAVQAPANAGALSPTGKLGVPVGGDAGFDIHSDLWRGRTVANHAYAAVPTTGGTRLYTVDLLTGAARETGRLPVRVTDIAVDLDR